MRALPHSGCPEPRWPSCWGEGSAGAFRARQRRAFPDPRVRFPAPFPAQFKRLQGKRNRGREEINFVEIKGDDQLSGVQQWLTKSLTEEQSMKSFSKVCRAAHSLPGGSP